ncbi:unnamed protein product [Adineta steineri]|uniref:Uncharacterized protein n=1 Tax=Adineta steineri TaxID=433720 RepID=A0A814YGU8_9BILA|nr:unnamed protein product [Adineta steineri]CAF3651514.1 unnamed protein product [Adineta steineri]
MKNTLYYYLLLSTSTLLVVISAKYISGDQGLAQFDLNQKATPQDYNGPWGEGVTCPYNNPPFPDGTTTYKGTVPSAMTTDAVNYLRDSNVGMFQVSDTKTYPNLDNLYFVMRKEFHTWHYSGGQLLTGCWIGVTIYQYINQP